MSTEKVIRGGESLHTKEGAACGEEGNRECGHAEHQHGEHHHEEHHHTAEGFPDVTVFTHDVATVGSLKCRINGEYEAALDALQECMVQTAKAVEAAGGIVGHVKAFAREEARSCMISVTGREDIQRKPSKGKSVYVEEANIVFGVGPQQLEKILSEAFAAYLNK